MNMRHLGNAVEGFFSRFKERVKIRDFPLILLFCLSMRALWHSIITGGVYLDSPGRNC